MRYIVWDKGATTERAKIFSVENINEWIVLRRVVGRGRTAQATNALARELRSEASEDEFVGN